MLFALLLRESTSGVHEGDFEVMMTAADLVARALETFFSSSAATFDVVTYRTLSRKFAVTAQVGKRLLWTILNTMRLEEREKWTCVVYVSRERRVELKRLEEEGNEFEGEEDVAVYALVRKREEENVLEQLVREEEKETKMQLDSEEDVSWMLKHGAFAKSDVAKRLPRGKKFTSSGATTKTATTTKSAAEQKKPAASAATAKKPSATGPKSGNIASMFGGTGKKTVAKPKAPKKKTTPKKKTPEKKKAKTPTPKKKAPAATNADAMIEDEEGDSDSDDLGGGGRGNRRLSGGKRAFVDDEEEEEEEEEEEPATTPVKKMKKSDEDSEPPSPEIIDKEPEEEETPRRRSTRSTPSKAAPTPKSSSKKEKPLSKKAQKDIVKARKARMQKKVIEEMDDETGEELMRTIFVDPTTNEECNEDGTLKAK